MDLATVATTVGLIGGGGVVGWIGRGTEQLRDRRERKRQEREEAEQRNWHGWIDPHAVTNWSVRLMDHPKSPTAIVVLEVLDTEGAPDVNRAQSLRQQVEADGEVVRKPSKTEWDFLVALWSERRGKGGNPIR